MVPMKLRILRGKLINAFTIYLPLYRPSYLQRIVGFYEVLHALRKHSIEGDIVECGVGWDIHFILLDHL